MKTNPAVQGSPSQGEGAKAKQVQVRLDGSMMEKVERIASVNHLSVSDVVRLALRAAVPNILENGLTLKPAA